ncbi:DUF6221 family protein [Actinosynnema sp. NPDC051121]
MTAIIRLDDDEVDALYAWIEREIERSQSAAENASGGFTSTMDSWRPSATDSPALHQQLHRPGAVLTECEEQRQLLADLRPHLHASTPTGKLARLVLQRLGASLSSRSGYREEWRPPGTPS